MDSLAAVAEHLAEDADREFLQSAQSFILDCFSDAQLPDTSLTKVSLTLEGLDAEQYKVCEELIAQNFGVYHFMSRTREDLVEAEKDRREDEVLFCREVTIMRFSGRDDFRAPVAIIIKFLGFKRGQEYGVKMLLKKFEERPRAIQLALAMSQHSALGRDSLLKDLNADILSKIMKTHVYFNMYSTFSLTLFSDMMRALCLNDKIYIDIALKQIKHSGTNDVDFVFHLPDGIAGVQECEAMFALAKDRMQRYVLSESRTVARSGETGLVVRQKLNTRIRRENSDFAFTFSFQTQDAALEGRPSIRVTNFFTESSREEEITLCDPNSFGFFVSSLLLIL